MRVLVEFVLYDSVVAVSNFERLPSTSLLERQPHFLDRARLYFDFCGDFFFNAVI